MKEKWKGGALLAPVPAVLVSCGNGNRINVFTVAWTGIICSHPPKTYISIRPERYSYEFVHSDGVFTINLPTAEQCKELDFCGVRSGRTVNKFKACGFTAEKCNEIDTVSIAECPISIECKVTDIIKLGSHDMFIADILCVDVDSKFIENGKLRLDKCNLISYSHGEYYKLGKKLGKFGYSVEKKTKRKKTVLNKHSGNL